MHKQIVVYPYNRVLLNNKNNVCVDIFNYIVNESQNLYAK